MAMILLCESNFIAYIGDPIEKKFFPSNLRAIEVEANNLEEILGDIPIEFAYWDEENKKIVNGFERFDRT